MKEHFQGHSSLWLGDNQAYPSWPEAQPTGSSVDFTVAGLTVEGVGPLERPA